VALLAAMALAATPAPQAQLLDRVLAIVSGSVLTLSDARLVLDMGFVQVPSGKDPVGVAVAWLIERELVLNEAARYEAGEDDFIGVEAALSVVRRRFPTEAAWAAAKRRNAQTDDSLRLFMADSLSAEQFVERRFATLPPPVEADLLTYFEQHRSEFGRGGVAASFEQVRDRVELQVRGERRARAVAEWMARLRRRADVSELYTISR
jgi:parvulin-like peptidyl-prolyl isomerase